MMTSDFDYNLPKELIAQMPLEPRDSSRLMIISRKNADFASAKSSIHDFDRSQNRDKKIEERHFFDIVDYLQPGDLLVWNNTKVFKARLRGNLVLDENVMEMGKIDSTDKIWNSAPIEIFLVKPMENNKVWTVLAKPGRKLRLGMTIVFADDFRAEVMLKEKDGTFLIQFDEDDMCVRAKANKYGEVPLPPYVESPKTQILNSQIDQQYQTVYAKEEGSVAAPTAGFHFTPDLIEKLKAKGVEFAEVTLHVGLGTFLPVKTEKIEEHKMHSEHVELTAKNADLINQAKAEGRRVVAVGTTTVRVLEGITKTEGILRPYTGDINIFIFPGFEFQVVDALITNFHLPKSTLLMLVSAFAGDKDFVLECYQKAVEQKYRFFSFGDAMFIK
jgi:S-adenosylmethionine:tRNA ribosyltransferase-isomerase